MVAYMIKVNTVSYTCGSLMTSLVLRPEPLPVFEWFTVFLGASLSE